MDTKATAILSDGSKISGRLTTDHAASSYGQPVFVDENNAAINWAIIESIFTSASELGKIGGKSTSEAKKKTARENGRKGGRPRNKAG